MDILDAAAEHCQSLRIRWLKSHSDYIGNELVDTAARTGRDDYANPDL